MGIRCQTCDLCIFFWTKNDFYIRVSCGHVIDDCWLFDNLFCACGNKLPHPCFATFRSERTPLLQSKFSNHDDVIAPIQCKLIPFESVCITVALHPIFDLPSSRQQYKLKVVPYTQTQFLPFARSLNMFFIFRPYFIWERKIFKSNGFFFTKFAKNYCLRNMKKYIHRIQLT